MLLGVVLGTVAHAPLTVTALVAVGIAVWLGIFAARKFEGVPVTSAALYHQFELSADTSDPHQSAGAERDIRDSTIEPG